MESVSADLLPPGGRVALLRPAVFEVGVWMLRSPTASRATLQKREPTMLTLQFGPTHLPRTKWQGEAPHPPPAHTLTPHHLHHATATRLHLQHDCLDE